MQNNSQIAEIAQRIFALRDIMGISEQEMADCCGMSLEDYKNQESGTVDFSLTFLLNCSKRFGVELVELMTGETPHLKQYSVVRKGKGLDVIRRKSFKYEHMAFSFKNKTAEPFYVVAPYEPEAQDMPILLSVHEGQEMDYIIEGKLKIQIDGHTEYLSEGDCVYYDSKTPHGMIAVDGKDCKFLAVVMKPQKPEK